MTAVDTGEDPFNRHSNYGPATFDRRHIFVATYDYHLPFFKSMNSVGKAVLSGWEVSGITRFQSGGYFTPTANTAIGTRRADYVGGPVLVSDPRVLRRLLNGICIPGSTRQHLQRRRRLDAAAQAWELSRDRL